MMKKYAIGFLCAAILLVSVAATVRNQGFFVSGGFGGEPILGAENNGQSAPWINFTSNGVSVFQVPSTGIIPVENGGTGVRSAATVPVFVVFTGTNGLLYTNQIINGTTR